MKKATSYSRVVVLEDGLKITMGSLSSLCLSLFPPAVPEGKMKPCAVNEVFVLF
jgi:hypothetical protein